MGLQALTKARQFVSALTGWYCREIYCIFTRLIEAPRKKKISQYRKV